MSKSLFSKSTPTILHKSDSVNKAPPLPAMPADSSNWSPAIAAPSQPPSRFFSTLKRKSRVASASTAQWKTDPQSRPRTRSFGEYLGLTGSPSSGSSSSKRDGAVEQAPELPPLPQMSALHVSDLDNLTRVPRTPRVSRKGASFLPFNTPPVRPLSPRYRDRTPGHSDHQHMFRSISQPAYVSPVEQQHREWSPAHHDTPASQMPVVPQLDGVWEGFLAETAGQGASCLDLRGAVKAALELDYAGGLSPATLAATPGTPTRSTSESALPYLLRTPTIRAATLSPRPDDVSSGTPLPLPSRRTPRSPGQVSVADSQNEGISRATSTFSLSLFPLPPTQAPSLPPPLDLSYIPSRPAPQPPSNSILQGPLPKWEPLRLRPPLRDRHTTPPKIGAFSGMTPDEPGGLTGAPMRPVPQPSAQLPPTRRPKLRRPPTAESTSSSATAGSWDEIFDSFDQFDRESSRSTSGGRSSRATSPSQHNSRPHSRNPSLQLLSSPTPCEFFSPPAAARAGASAGKDGEFKWGYAV